MKVAIWVWKKALFLYNLNMSAFKTKKISTKNISSPLLETKEKFIPEDTHTISWFRLSKKVIVGSLLGLIIVIFTGEMLLRAFQGNEKNGSQSFTSSISTTVETYISKKVIGTTNILIAGIWGKWHDGSDLTDSIMLASLDGDKNTVTLLSIPRDLYIAYPVGRWAGRINSLYDIGKRDDVGIRYLSDKVSEITGQAIDHYMVIDFSGFQDIIDTLGGVEIDVPTDIIDREYPNDNWGYTTFRVNKWPQIFDGATALKYARSRHSTSDFDRSNRQQLLIKAIKEKATDLGIITNPKKIGDIYTSLISHLDTDLSIAGMAEIALAFSDIQSDAISIVSLSESCLSLTKCSPWSYLYSPSRDLFWGNAVIIPENARVNKLSYYDDIRKFVDLTFRFPILRKSERNIVFITDPLMRRRTQEIGIGLAKLWFPISFDKTLTISTGSIEKSHINVYWNSDVNVWIHPESDTVTALRYIEESLPYTIVDRNEYINTGGPKIEIIIGKDGEEYFKNLRSAYYVPAPTKISSGSTGSTYTGAKTGTWTLPKTTSGESTITAWEWENF